jgi:hypothetical protein
LAGGLGVRPALSGVVAPHRYGWPMTEPRRDWPDVLPGAFVVTARRAPYGLALASIVLILIGLAAVASSAETPIRLTLTVVSAVVGLAGVSLLFRFLQAGKPQLIADAAGVKTTLNPLRMPWDRLERVRIMPNRFGGSARIGVVPLSIDEALTPRMNAERLVKMLQSRQQREGAPFVVSLTATGISPAEARERLTELAAGRVPITD